MLQFSLPSTTGILTFYGQKSVRVVGIAVVRHLVLLLWTFVSGCRRHPTPTREMLEPLLCTAAAVGLDLDVSSSKALADSLDRAVVSFLFIICLSVSTADIQPQMVPFHGDCFVQLLACQASEFCFMLCSLGHVFVWPLFLSIDGFLLLGRMSCRVMIHTLISWFGYWQLGVWHR